MIKTKASTVKAKAAARGCTAGRTEDLQPDHKTPYIEVFAPDGKRFGCGAHSLICEDWDDAARCLDQETIEECPKDCHCKEEPDA